MKEGVFMLRGIDVSQHNNIINWDKVKSQVDFAILRLGWIGNKENHTLDQLFERNYNECKRVGIPVGLYVYSYCNNTESSKSGAKWVISQILNKNLDLELPIYIDMEDESLIGFNKDTLTAIACQFNYELEKQGLWAGVYANLNWYENYLDKEIIKKRFTTWIAHYEVKENKYENEYDMLQYKVGKKDTIDGIDTTIDLNVMYRDLLSEIGKYKIDNNPKPQFLKTTDDIVQEIIDGKWGNGEDRKINLTNAGYNYEEIQSKVNEKMQNNRYLTYVVKSGDSLTKIAKRYNTTWKEIYNLNKNSIGNNPNFIRIGMQLKIKI